MGANPLTDDAAVCAAVSLLHLTQHPGDSAAAYHVAASSLGAAVGLADHTPDAVRPVARAVSAAVADRGLAAVLNGWLMAVADDCTERNVARFAQLVELAHAFDADPAADLDRFVARVRTTKVEDRRPARVKVMTVHASKGRQFTFVVLPDLDNSLLGRAPAVLVDRPDVLGPAACLTTPPKADVVALHPQLQTMDAAWRARQSVEELCTLYVAVTRAEVGLEMICHPRAANARGEPTLPSTAAGLLRAALAPTAATTPDTVLWHRGQEPAAEAGVGGDDVPAADPLRVDVEPAGAASVRRAAVAPSGLEGGGRRRLGDGLSLGTFDGRAIGTVLHRWFEQVEWLDAGVPDDGALRRAAADLAVPADRLPGLLRQFRAACDRPEIVALLRRPAGDVAALREQPFVARARPAEGPVTLVQGQLDRLVLRRVNGQVVSADVVDFKTDTADSPRIVRELTEHYAPQLRAYRDAVAAWLGLPVSDVTARLAFVSCGWVVAVD